MRSSKLPPVRADESIPRGAEENVTPVIEEQLRAGVRTIKTGAVRVHKKVHEREELVDQLLTRETVEVSRIAKNERVDGPLPVRQVGDTTIIPVVKEVLKIEKQFVLVEELHLTKKRVQERHKQNVMLRAEEASVERVDGMGNTIEPVEPQKPVNSS